MIPIILLYAFGIIFFILALEGKDTENLLGKEKENDPKDLIYNAMSIFMNVIAYFSSFSNPDYVNLSYIPVAFVVVSILLLIYKVYLWLPKGTDAYGDDTEDEDYKNRPDPTR
jgi:hypothetical protein